MRGADLGRRPSHRCPHFFRDVGRISSGLLWGLEQIRPARGLSVLENSGQEFGVHLADED